MLFVITAIDKEGSLSLRLATREAHFAYVKETGAVRLGGPFLDAQGEMAGSMIVLEAADLASARVWAQNDPYAKAGLFESLDVRSWKATANFCEAKL
jgi:uncharacterized protein YciI